MCSFLMFWTKQESEVGQDRCKVILKHQHFRVLRATPRKTRDSRSEAALSQIGANSKCDETASSTVELASPEPVNVMCDGDICGFSPVKMSVEHQSCVCGANGIGPRFRAHRRSPLSGTLPTHPPLATRTQAKPPASRTGRARGRAAQPTIGAIGASQAILRDFLREFPLDNSRFRVNPRWNQRSSLKSFLSCTRLPH